MKKDKNKTNQDLDTPMVKSKKLLFFHTAAQALSISGAILFIFSMAGGVMKSTSYEEKINGLVEQPKQEYIDSTIEQTQAAYKENLATEKELQAAYNLKYLSNQDFVKKYADAQLKQQVDTLTGECKKELKPFEIAMGVTGAVTGLSLLCYFASRAKIDIIDYANEHPETEAEEN